MQTHWGIDDPADTVGTQAEIEAAFLQAYDRLLQRITMFLNLPAESMSAVELKPALDKIGLEGI